MDIAEVMGVVRFCRESRDPQEGQCIRENSEKKKPERDKERPERCAKNQGRESFTTNKRGESFREGAEQFGAPGGAGVGGHG